VKRWLGVDQPSRCGQAAIAGFLFGYDTGIIGAALPLVGTDLGHKLSIQEQEIITASTTIGAIFGALGLGFLADKIGRKWSMTIADILQVQAPLPDICIIH
jgi:MFS transporter, SP family, solute carrier family 2 (myo-inositol transporter), member 13